MKKLILLGASGSIGLQSIDVIEKHPEDFELVAFSVGKRIETVRTILNKMNVSHVCVQQKEDCELLQQEYPDVHFCWGDEGLIELVTLEQGDTVINALVGFVGLIPTLKAIEAKKNIALANKETLIVGGKFVKEAIKRNHVTMTPIDSEHSAIFQCLQGNDKKTVEKLIITASGGSFRDRSREEIKNVTVKEALSHPNWSMGAKITIDSATLMNKGFEVIEAHYLFDIDYDQIDVLLHRESIVHSMVEYCDHSIIAQLGNADMRLPIQYALSHPSRFSLNTESLDLAKVGTLHFEKVDEVRYPFLKLAYDMGRKEGNACAIMNAANEVAVACFLENKISFLEIEELVFKAIEAIPYIENATLEDVIASDKAARKFVLDCVKGV